MRRAARPTTWVVVCLALGVAACAGEGGPPADTTSGTSASATAGPVPDLAWYDAEEMAAAQDDTAAVWLTAWFVPEALEGVTVADLEARYRRVSGFPAEPAAEELARAAFA